MPATIRDIPECYIDELCQLGQSLRAFRKMHGITQVILAESLQIDRRTLAKLENGDPNVTLGTAFKVWKELEFELELRSPAQQEAHQEHMNKNYLPMQIPLADYPVLKRCSWQLQANDSVTPQMAYRLYQDKKADIEPRFMSRKESNLFNCLEEVYGPINPI